MTKTNRRMVVEICAGLTIVILVVWQVPRGSTLERHSKINQEAKTAVPVQPIIDSLESVAQITSNSGGGSGFVVGRSTEGSTYVLTSHQVVENDIGAGGELASAQLAIRGNSTEPSKTKLRLLCFDIDRDLALLDAELASDELKELEIQRAAELPEKKDSLFVVGFPMGRLSVQGTTRSGSGPMYWREAKYWRLADYSHSGQRGSPVMNKKGDVVGVWCGINHHKVGFCITLPEITAFLDENGYSALCR